MKRRVGEEEKRRTSKDTNEESGEAK